MTNSNKVGGNADGRLRYWFERVNHSELGKRAKDLHTAEGRTRFQAYLRSVFNSPGLTLRVLEAENRFVCRERQVVCGNLLPMASLRYLAHNGPTNRSRKKLKLSEKERQQLQLSCPPLRGLCSVDRVAVDANFYLVAEYTVGSGRRTPLITEVVIGRRTAEFQSAKLLSTAKGLLDRMNRDIAQLKGEQSLKGTSNSMRAPVATAHA